MLDLFFIMDLIPDILKGLMVTLELSIISFGIGFALAAFFMPARIFGGLLLSSIVRSYIELFRGTPLLVQLLLIYFGLPALGIKFDPMTASILAFGLNSAAYQSEILRSSLKSIPESQFLSGESLGMSSLQIYRYIILPQVVRVAVPALVNEFVALIKESSIASIIGVVELTRRGEYLVATTFRALEVYIAVAIIYFVICFLVSQSTRLLEKKFKIPGYERGGA